MTKTALGSNNQHVPFSIYIITSCICI